MIYPATLALLPRQGAKGQVQLPGSKSISNRMLLLAALAKGSTMLRGLLDSDDTRVMIDSLQKLGVQITHTQEGCLITGVGSATGSVFPVNGSADNPVKLFVGNSGLTIRTLVPAIAASLSVSGGCVELSGVPRMHERPIGDLVDGLRSIGAQIDYLEREGFPPLRIRGVPIRVENEIVVRGDTSSQFLTGLLQAAPLFALQLQQPIFLRVDGQLISQPYVDITIATLKKFGVVVQHLGNSYSIAPQVITAPAVNSAKLNASELLPSQLPASAISSAISSTSTSAITPAKHAVLNVEGDASSASYFLAAGLIGGGPVRVLGAGKDSVQGDIHFAHALEKMGARITWGPDWIESSRRHCEEPLRGDVAIEAIDFDCNHIPDAAMTLVICALFANKPSTLRNIGSWRVKETDRITAMATECRKLGATVNEGPDWIEIYPLGAKLNQSTPSQSTHDLSTPDQITPNQLTPGGPLIETYDDHRVAMCFSLASFGKTPIQIHDPGCVAKTFPQYFEVFSGLCANAVPVIAIDGPTASGKGTIASLVAQKLGFGYLDSGALYRLTALAAKQKDADFESEHLLTSIATSMEIGFHGQSILLAGQDVTEEIRDEAIGLLASKIAAYPGVRSALLLRQRDFAQLPGLVADGRDMGSVVFTGAQLKVFLTASAESRAQRRYKQLIAKGFSCNLDSLFADLKARDTRDTTRAIAPLKPAPGALVIDSTSLSIDQVVQSVVDAWKLCCSHEHF